MKLFDGPPVFNDGRTLLVGHPLFGGGFFDHGRLLTFRKDSHLVAKFGSRLDGCASVQRPSNLPRKNLSVSLLVLFAFLCFLRFCFFSHLANGAVPSCRFGFVRSERCGVVESVPKGKRLR